MAEYIDENKDDIEAIKRSLTGYGPRDKYRDFLIANIRSKAEYSEFGYKPDLSDDLDKNIENLEYDLNKWAHTLISFYDPKYYDKWSSNPKEAKQLRMI